MEYAIGQFVRIKPDIENENYNLNGSMRDFVRGKGFICKICGHHNGRYIFDGLGSYTFPEGVIFGYIEDPVEREKKRSLALTMLCQKCREQCGIFRTFGKITESNICDRMKKIVGMVELFGDKTFPHQTLSKPQVSEVRSVKYHQVAVGGVKTSVREQPRVQPASPVVMTNYHSYPANVRVPTNTQDGFDRLMTELSLERVGGKRWTFINGSHPHPSTEIWGRLKNHTVVLLQPKTLRIRIMDDRT